MPHTIEPPKKPPKEPTKEPLKEPTKKPPKKPPKEPTKEPPKKPPKEPTKEPPKQPPLPPLAPTPSSDVKKATGALDAVSGTTAQASSARAKFDEMLQNKAPDKVWSDVVKKARNSLEDPELTGDLDDVFSPDLGTKLKSWGDLVKSGKPDRDALLKLGQEIAVAITSYDQQLANLANLTPSMTDATALNVTREALRAIAGSMSYTTSYLDKKGLWKQ